VEGDGGVDVTVVAVAVCVGVCREGVGDKVV